MININDSHINPELTFKRLVYLHMQQLTNFPYIEKDFDALTDYELLCLVVKFLNDVIKNSNDQNDSITNLYNAFLALQDYMNNSVQELEDAWNDKTNELEEEWQEKTTEIETAFNNLQTWIDNYFDNLDVQDEINNKLDQMLEDGVLEQIIEQFIQSTALWCFDTVALMKLATNFTNGSYAKTMGYYTLNDGGASIYKIRTKTNEDVIDEMKIISLYDETLIAELIINDDMNVECFGAYGDNTHDDYLSIQTAINTCNVVNLLNKTYKTSTIKILSNKDLIIRGHKSKLQFNRTDWQTDISTINGTILNNLEISDVNNTNNIEIYDVIFDGNCSNATEDITTRDYTFDMLMLENVNKVTIENCEFTNSYQGGLRLSGVKQGNIINNKIYSIGKGAIDSIVLERNAINVIGFYYDNVNQQNVYLTNTSFNIIGNTIYDIVDECFCIRGVKNCFIENNNIYDIGQDIIEYFNQNTNAENKIISVANNSINNTGSQVFVFNDTYEINGTLNFNVVNNNITNIGGFTTYRSDTGYHYISNVKDYANLIYRTHDDNGAFKLKFENNYFSLVATPNTQSFVICPAEMHFNNNIFDCTTLNNYLVDARKYGFYFNNNKVFASDNLSNRYRLFLIKCPSIFENNEITATYTTTCIRLDNIESLIQNNKFINSLEVGTQYTTLIDNDSNSGTYCIISNNLISKIPRVFTSSLSNTTNGTCLLSGNILDITALGTHNFANISKQGNYPTTFND